MLPRSKTWALIKENKISLATLPRRAVFVQQAAFPKIFHVIIVKVYDRIYTYIYAVCPSFGLGLGPNPSTQDILIIIINYQVLK